MRRQLAGTAAAVTLMVMISFLVPLALVLRGLAREQSVRAGEVQARSIAGLLAGGVPTEAVDGVLAGENATGPRLASVTLPDGRVLGQPREPGDSSAAARAGGAFSQNRADGAVEIYVPVAGAVGPPTVVRVVVPKNVVVRGVWRTWLLLGAIGAVLVVLAVAVFDRLARSTTRPMVELRRVTQRLEHGDFSARAVPTGPPEVVEAARAINVLADRIGTLLAAEREAAADLSHELRTPLTALRLHAESIGDTTDRERVSGGVRALERSVDRVIEQARGATASDLVVDRCDIGAVATARVRFWEVVARTEERLCTLDVPPEPVWARISPGGVESAVDALVGNVLAHTPRGTGFCVTVRSCGDERAALTVSDDGPGLSDRRLLARGASPSGGTGLGLDIARRTAESSGGSLTFGPGPGASVVLAFGPE